MYWSHDHAERIVVDNPMEGIGHVWLITRYASFREWQNLAAVAAGSGLRLYSAHSPSDEYRQLSYDTASGGWQLKGLDGSVEFFRSDGQWLKTVFPADPAHPVQGAYTGNQLTRVDFPDGRSEIYTYYPSGKLRTITENAVGGAAVRTWTYGWSMIGDHLVTIQRPDGTAWEFTYGANNAPPDFLSQIRLIGTDGTTGRVAAAFDYDTSGRVQDSWRGDPSFTDPHAVDKQSFSYTGSPLVTQTVVSQVVSASFTNVTTLSLGRDTASAKGKIVSMSGNCPTCGLPPSTTFSYGDPANPLFSSAMVDGRNIRTEYIYDANGRLLSRTEAKGVAGQERTTTWLYDTNFPSLAKEIDQPSTTSGQTRKTFLTYDPTTSLPTRRTITGFENGASFSFATDTTYNGAGRPLTIDPPGYTTQDVTSFTYNVPNTNGYLPDTRTDPLIGTTSFAYDGLNRQTSVTDVNGVQTITAYDALNRVTSVTRKGDPTAGIADLVTTYLYDCPAGSCGPFRDLRCVQLPGGNGMTYLYDAAGRLTEVDRKADCTPASPILERTVYTLDGAGNFSLEELKHLDAGIEVSDGKTEYIYTCHLDKTTLGKGSTPQSTESVTEYCYDEDDNLKQIWDANHPRGNPGSPNPSTQTYTYDSLNRLTRVSQPWTTGTADTQYAYDLQDHLAQLTDAEGNVTTYTTSDRDLMTRQISPVSGTTTYAYNEHGQLITQADGRGITTVRTVDPLDRVTLVHYSDGTTLDVSYTYDMPCTFGKSKLCAITQGGTTVGYLYDRFGRATQDGTLAYQYDANGNRTQITYPGNVTARYAYDFADRQSTLSYNAGAGSQPVVTSAKYLSSGPLTQLVLGNGLTEQHLFDTRYFPQKILVTGPSTLTWTYLVDGVGNITQIDDGTSHRTYSYVDGLYFLKQGDGPWGSRAWSYDRIGNRLTETRDTTTDTYSYTSHNPRLQSIALGGGAGTRSYTYDSAGDEIRVSSPMSVLDLRYDGANRPVQLLEETTRAASYLTYDGRDYLVQSRQEVNTCSPVATQALYSSDGILYSRSVKNLLTNTISKDTKVLIFAGEPVALLETTPSVSLSFLSVDHLGAPILETNASGGSLWSGGFEPFGKDSGAAQGAGEFLRFPGQWEDVSWQGGISTQFVYNDFRWYEPAIGRYIQADPLARSAGSALFVGSAFLGTSPADSYLYVESNPMGSTDPLGLGRTFPCGGGCSITLTGKGTGDGAIKGRHIHWQCQGKSGCIKENGEICDKGKSDLPTREIKKCIQRWVRGFRTDPKPICPPKEFSVPKPGPVPLGIGIAIGTALVCVFCEPCCAALIGAGI